MQATGQWSPQHRPGAGFQEPPGPFIPNATYCPCGPQSVGSCDRCAYGYCARHGDDGVCCSCRTAPACVCGQPSAFPCDECGSWFCRRDGRTATQKTWDRDDAVFTYSGGVCDACVRAAEVGREQAAQAVEREKTEARQRRTDVLAAIDDPIERFLTVMAGFDTSTSTSSRFERLPRDWAQSAAKQCSDLVASDGTVRLSVGAVGKWFASRAAARGLPTTTIEVVRRGWMREKAKAHQAWVLAAAYESSINRSDDKHASDVYVLADGRLFMQDLSYSRLGQPPVALSAVTTAAPPVAYTIMGRLLRLGS